MFYRFAKFWCKIGLLCLADEVPLIGGNVTGAVRVGNTVRRATGSWSPAVHGLLRHLEARGFDGAPRFLGFDQQGREILTFIEGEVGNYPLPHYMWSDEVLLTAAHFLRRYHDAVTDYKPPAGAPWQFVYPDASRHEVICHNDVAPYNMVYVAGLPRALIDFDTAGPGPGAWDMAYAAYRFVPLGHTHDEALQRLGLTEPSVQARRFRLFCNTYGSVRAEEVLELVEPRLQALCTHMVNRATAGDISYQRMIDEGHLDGYLRDIEDLRRYYPVLLQGCRD